VPAADWRVADAEWPPAGPDWRAARHADIGLALVGAELQHTDPKMMAALWSRLLAHPLDGMNLKLENGTLRFVEATDGRGPGLGGIEVAVKDRSRAGEMLTIGGTRIYLV
jgi:hypothetical protein